MAPEGLSSRRYRCRYCGAELPAWLPVFQAPNGALRLDHLSAMHPDQVGAYLNRINMATINSVG